MPSFSGVWTISAVVQAIGGQTWPSYVDTSTRAVFAATSTGGQNSLSYINITEPGDSVDFGDLLYDDNYAAAACASSTRGLYSGGTSGAGPVASNSINFITMATTGNAVDFGDMIYQRTQHGGLSNSTRGLFIVGWQNGAGTTATMEYVTMASTGNAVNFGNADQAYYGPGGNQGASSTRGIWAGGYQGSTATSYIYYITIATTGNASSFGELTHQTQLGAGCSSSTRALYVGGYGWPNFNSLNNIDYMTIASTGNAIDFGDMTVGGYRLTAVSSSTRGIFAGASGNNNINYVTIATLGNATDFGDLIVSGGPSTGTSNCHGGL
jgi:hypothetical protein